MFDLMGKTAIVTGGNGGIGLGLAEGLAAQGASILIAGRNEQKNETALARLRSQGAVAEAMVVDVTQEDQCQAMIDRAEARFGTLDILINNAGTGLRKRPQDNSLEDWHMIMDTNLTSTFMCCKAAYGPLKKQGGKIINIGSMLSIFGVSFAAPYGASKGGVVQLTLSLASAWARDNIQVNAILPGWIDTDLTRSGNEKYPGFREQIIERTPAGRWGQPEDLAGLGVFLASAASDFVTGTAIPVDGGYAAQG